MDFTTCKKYFFINYCLAEPFVGTTVNRLKNIVENMRTRWLETLPEKLAIHGVEIFVITFQVSDCFLFLLEVVWCGWERNWESLEKFGNNSMDEVFSSSCLWRNCAICGKIFFHSLPYHSKRHFSTNALYVQQNNKSSSNVSHCRVKSLSFSN